MSWTAKPSAKAGRYPKAGELEAVIDQVDSLTVPGWIDYTTIAPSGGSAFTLTGSGGNPAQNNATYQAWYRRPTDSDRIDVRIRVLIGSTFVVGTGDYRFGLPFNASASAIAAGLGLCYYLDASAGTNYVGVARAIAAGYVQLIVDRQANYLGAANPVVPATSDEYVITYSYEPA